MEAAGNHRPTETDARCRRLETRHVPTAKTELRQRIAELEGPLVSASTRLDRNDIRREASVLGKKRARQDVHGLHAVDGYGGAKLAGCRVRGIAGIDQQSAAVFA